MSLPVTHEARNARVRHLAATTDDLRHMRFTDTGSPLMDRAYRCDCRCHCHGAAGGAPTATGAPIGSCGLRIDLDTLDCGRACRAQHILASECSLDETRGAGVHV